MINLKTKKKFFQFKIREKNYGNYLILIIK